MPRRRPRRPEEQAKTPHRRLLFHGSRSRSRSGPQPPIQTASRTLLRKPRKTRLRRRNRRQGLRPQVEAAPPAACLRRPRLLPRRLLRAARQAKGDQEGLQGKDERVEGGDPLEQGGEAAEEGGEGEEEEGEHPQDRNQAAEDHQPQDAEEDREIEAAEAPKGRS